MPKIILGIVVINEDTPAVRHVRENQLSNNHREEKRRRLCLTQLQGNYVFSINFEGDLQLWAFIHLSMLFLQKTGERSVHQTGAADTMDITDQPRNRPR